MSRPLATRTLYSLRLKLTVPLILLVLTPLGASLWLIEQITDTAANFHAAEAEQSLDAIDKAEGAYRELFETTKRLQAEIADRLGKQRELQVLDPKMDIAKVLAEESRLEPTLRALAVVGTDGKVVAEASRPTSGDGYRDKVVEQPLASGATLDLTFEVSATLQDEYAEAQGDARHRARHRRVPHGVAADRLSATRSSRCLAALVVVAAVIGCDRVDAASPARSSALVTTARRVSDGQLDARVQICRGATRWPSSGSAFNTMLDDLDARRARRSQYLQRMGAWQDVARRLAHEIKNPLTPIQLAVQQMRVVVQGRRRALQEAARRHRRDRRRGDRRAAPARRHVPHARRSCRRSRRRRSRSPT